MADEQISRRQTAPDLSKLENVNFLHAHPDPSAVMSRHYSFDHGLGPAAPFANLNVDYDQTEGMGGISVSSYDSIDDDRGLIDVRGHHYPGSYYHPVYPDEYAHAPGMSTPSDVSSSISPPNGIIGNTMYSTSLPGDRIASALSREEQGRLAAEEDRRRRNTAASARFRMKKKQREQILERSVRDASEKIASLEACVAQLELENRWLKDLLTEKHGSSGTSATPSASMPPPMDDTSPELRKVNSVSGTGQRHLQPKKKGVGTDS